MLSLATASIQEWLLYYVFRRATRVGRLLLKSSIRSSKYGNCHLTLPIFGACTSKTGDTCTLLHCMAASIGYGLVCLVKTTPKIPTSNPSVTVTHLLCLLQLVDPELRPIKTRQVGEVYVQIRTHKYTHTHLIWKSHRRPVQTLLTTQTNTTEVSFFTQLS